MDPQREIPTAQILKTFIQKWNKEGPKTKDTYKWIAGSYKNSVRKARDKNEPKVVRGKLLRTTKKTILVRVKRRKRTALFMLKAKDILLTGDLKHCSLPWFSSCTSLSKKEREKTKYDWNEKKSWWKKTSLRARRLKCQVAPGAPLFSWDKLHSKEHLPYFTTELHCLTSGKLEEEKSNDCWGEYSPYLQAEDDNAIYWVLPNAVC